MAICEGAPLPRYNPNEDKTMEWWIKTAQGKWIGPYPTWEHADEDKRLLHLPHAAIHRTGKVTMKSVTLAELLAG